MKYNSSVVHIPQSADIAECKKQVDQCPMLKSDHRYFLYWALDQVDTHALTVFKVRSALNWGEKKWKKVRDDLIGNGILGQIKKINQDRSSLWLMVIDLHPVFVANSNEPPRLSNEVTRQ